MLRTKYKLPESLRILFWDCDFSSVSWDKNGGFIIRRILDRGNWDAITWLRGAVGDIAIRDWLLGSEGEWLDPRKLRFWGLILNIPARIVDEWVQNARKSTWQGRHEG